MSRVAGLRPGLFRLHTIEDVEFCPHQFIRVAGKVAEQTFGDDGSGFIGGCGSRKAFHEACHRYAPDDTPWSGARGTGLRPTLFCRARGLSLSFFRRAGRHYSLQYKEEFVELDFHHVVAFFGPEIVVKFVRQIVVRSAA